MRKRVLLTLAALRVVLLATSAVAGQVPSPGAAQHPQEYRHYGGPPVTLPELLREATDKNPELIALRKQIDVVRQRPAQERGLNPPVAETQIWQWPINSISPANTNMYMFMVSQEIPGRGKRDLRVAVAEKDVALAENDVTARARQIIGEIKQAYATLFIARKAIDVHLESVDLLRQIADVSQVKYRTGRISQQDVLKPVLELSKLHSDIVAFDEQANVATARLNIVLDRAPETPIGPLVEPREEMLVPATADVQRIALERHPELQHARLEVERAEAELAVARGDYKPDFSLQGGYMLAPRMTDAWMGSIAITWPKAPWSRGKIDAHIAEQSATVEAARARARAMENTARLAVHEAYVRAKAAQERAALLRTTILPQSQHTLEVSRVAYQTDRVDFQALIDNERMLLDARLDYFRALSDFSQALADLERAVGSDLLAGTTAPVTVQEIRR
jgi:outer membrane protein TolC